MSKLLKCVSAIAIAAVATTALAVSASAKTATFSNVTLGNHVMSGQLEGTLSTGSAWTMCNDNVYYIHVAVQGYVVANNGEHCEAGYSPNEDYYSNYVYAYTGGHEPIGVYTGSYWSAHEIRDGVNGVGRYLAVIDI